MPIAIGAFGQTLRSSPSLEALLERYAMVHSVSNSRRMKAIAPTEIIQPKSHKIHTRCGWLAAESPR